MEQHTQPTVSERRTRQNRLYRTALMVSLLLHVVWFFFWRGVPLPPSPFSAAGPRSGDFRAAGGGMQAMNLQVPPSRPIVPPLVPIISPDIIEPVEFDPEPQLDLSNVLAEGSGMAEGPPGIEGGRGRGDGGTAAEGLFSVSPPRIRSLIIPPTNSDLSGSKLDVWVFVTAQGRVVADSTRLNPPTRDRGFNRQVMREAAEWLFHPAERDGQAVAAWVMYTIDIG